MSTTDDMTVSSSTTISTTSTSKSAKKRRKNAAQAIASDNASVTSEATVVDSTDSISVQSDITDNTTLSKSSNSVNGSSSIAKPTLSPQKSNKSISTKTNGIEKSPMKTLMKDTTPKKASTDSKSGSKADLILLGQQLVKDSIRQKKPAPTTEAEVAPAEAVKDDKENKTEGVYTETVETPAADDSPISPGAMRFFGIVLVYIALNIFLVLNGPKVLPVKPAVTIVPITRNLDIPVIPEVNTFKQENIPSVIEEKVAADAIREVAESFEAIVSQDEEIASSEEDTDVEMQIIEDSKPTVSEPQQTTSPTLVVVPAPVNSKQLKKSSNIFSSIFKSLGVFLKAMKFLNFIFKRFGWYSEAH